MNTSSPQSFLKTAAALCTGVLACLFPASADDEGLDIPPGYSVAAYLNCGEEDAVGKTNGPRLRQVTGAPWRFESVTGPKSTAAFHESQIEMEIAGLNPKAEYLLGFTWWDADDTGHVQSVKFAEKGTSGWTSVLPATRAAAFYRGKPTWAHVILPVPAASVKKGGFRAAFAKHAGPNAVVSEVWLLEGRAEDTRKRVLLITGDDYPGHLWRETAPALAKALRADARLNVMITEAYGMVASPLLDEYDVVVLHFKNYAERSPLEAAAGENLARYVASGKGLVLSHFACGAFQEWKGFVDVAGRVWNPELRGHDPHGEFTVRMTGEAHPVTQGLKAFSITDELYTCLDGTPEIHVLCDAVSKVDKKAYPIAFAVPGGKGRVLHCVLGHDVAAFSNPGAAELYRRATAWAAGL